MPATPPFTDEHEELRDSIRRFVAAELRPHAERVGGRRAGSRTRSSPAWRELGFLGLKYPEEYGGQGGGYLHDAVLDRGARALRLAAGWPPGIGAHIGIATPPVWKFGTEEQKQRYLVPAIARREDRRARRSPSPAPAPTWPAFGRCAQQGRRRLRGQRLEDVHHQRRARGPRRHRREDDRAEGGHGGISFFLIVERAGRLQRRASSRSSAGARRTPPSWPSTDLFVPDENLLGEQNSGF